MILVATGTLSKLLLLVIALQYTSRGPKRGCNLVRLACNPGVIFVILILICYYKSVNFSNLSRDRVALRKLSWMLVKITNMCN